MKKTKKNHQKKTVSRKSKYVILSEEAIGLTFRKGKIWGQLITIKEKNRQKLSWNAEEGEEEGH